MRFPRSFLMQYTVCCNCYVFSELLREIDRLKSAKGDDFSSDCIQPEKAEVEILKERLLEANSKLAEATR